MALEGENLEHAAALNLMLFHNVCKDVSSNLTNHLDVESLHDEIEFLHNERYALLEKRLLLENKKLYRYKRERLPEISFETPPLNRRQLSIRRAYKKRNNSSILPKIDEKVQKIHRREAIAAFLGVVSHMMLKKQKKIMKKAWDAMQSQRVSSRRESLLFFIKSVSQVSKRVETQSKKRAWALLRGWVPSSRRQDSIDLNSKHHSAHLEAVKSAIFIVDKATVRYAFSKWIRILIRDRNSIYLVQCFSTLMERKFKAMAFKKWIVQSRLISSREKLLSLVLRSVNQAEKMRHKQSMWRAWVLLREQVLMAQRQKTNELNLKLGLVRLQTIKRAALIIHKVTVRHAFVFWYKLATRNRALCILLQSCLAVMDRKLIKVAFHCWFEQSRMVSSKGKSLTLVLKSVNRMVKMIEKQLMRRAWTLLRDRVFSVRRQETMNLNSKIRSIQLQAIKGVILVVSKATVRCAFSKWNRSITHFRLQCSFLQNCFIMMEQKLKSHTFYNWVEQSRVASSREQSLTLVLKYMNRMLRRSEEQSMRRAWTLLRHQVLLAQRQASTNLTIKLCSIRLQAVQRAKLVVDKVSVRLGFVKWRKTVTQDRVICNSLQTCSMVMDRRLKEWAFHKWIELSQMISYREKSLTLVLKSVNRVVRRSEEQSLRRAWSLLYSRILLAQREASANLNFKLRSVRLQAIRNLSLMVDEATVRYAFSKWKRSVAHFRMLCSSLQNCSIVMEQKLKGFAFYCWVDQSRTAALREKSLTLVLKSVNRVIRRSEEQSVRQAWSLLHSWVLSAQRQELMDSKVRLVHNQAMKHAILVADKVSVRLGFIKWRKSFIQDRAICSSLQSCSIMMARRLKVWAFHQWIEISQMMSYRENMLALMVKSINRAVRRTEEQSMRQAWTLLREQTLSPQRHILDNEYFKLRWARSQAIKHMALISHRANIRHAFKMWNRYAAHFQVQCSSLRNCILVRECNLKGQALCHWVEVSRAASFREKSLSLAMNSLVSKSEEWLKRRAWTSLRNWVLSVQRQELNHVNMKLSLARSQGLKRVKFIINKSTVRFAFELWSQLAAQHQNRCFLLQNCSLKAHKSLKRWALHKWINESRRISSREKLLFLVLKSMNLVVRRRSEEQSVRRAWMVLRDRVLSAQRQASISMGLKLQSVQSQGIKRSILIIDKALVRRAFVKWNQSTVKLRVFWSSIRKVSMMIEKRAVETAFHMWAEKARRAYSAVKLLALIQKYINRSARRSEEKSMRRAFNVLRERVLSAQRKVSINAILKLRSLRFQGIKRAAFTGHRAALRFAFSEWKRTAAQKSRQLLVIAHQGKLLRSTFLKMELFRNRTKEKAFYKWIELTRAALARAKTLELALKSVSKIRRRIEKQVIRQAWAVMRNRVLTAHRQTSNNAYLTLRMVRLQGIKRATLIGHNATVRKTFTKWRRLAIQKSRKLFIGVCQRRMYISLLQSATIVVEKISARSKRVSFHKWIELSRKSAVREKSLVLVLKSINWISKRSEEHALWRAWGLLREPILSAQRESSNIACTTLHSVRLQGIKRANLIVYRAKIRQAFATWKKLNDQKSRQLLIGAYRERLLCSFFQSASRIMENRRTRSNAHAFHKWVDISRNLAFREKSLALVLVSVNRVVKRSEERSIRRAWVILRGCMLLAQRQESVNANLKLRSLRLHSVKNMALILSKAIVREAFSRWNISAVQTQVKLSSLRKCYGVMEQKLKGYAFHKWIELSRTATARKQALGFALKSINHAIRRSEEQSVRQAWALLRNRVLSAQRQDSINISLKLQSVRLQGIKRAALIAYKAIVRTAFAKWNRFAVQYRIFCSSIQKHSTMIERHSVESAFHMWAEKARREYSREKLLNSVLEDSVNRVNRRNDKQSMCRAWTALREWDYSAQRQDSINANLKLRSLRMQAVKHMTLVLNKKAVWRAFTLWNKSAAQARVASFSLQKCSRIIELKLKGLAFHAWIALSQIAAREQALALALKSVNRMARMNNELSMRRAWTALYDHNLSAKRGQLYEEDYEFFDAMDGDGDGDGDGNGEGDGEGDGDSERLYGLSRALQITNKLNLRGAVILWRNSAAFLSRKIALRSSKLVKLAQIHQYRQVTEAFQYWLGYTRSLSYQRSKGLEKMMNFASNRFRQQSFRKLWQNWQFHVLQSRSILKQAESLRVLEIAGYAAKKIQLRFMALGYAALRTRVWDYQRNLSNQISHNTLKVNQNSRSILKNVDKAPAVQFEQLVSQMNGRWEKKMMSRAWTALKNQVRMAHRENFDARRMENFERLKIQNIGRGLKLLSQMSNKRETLKKLRSFLVWAVVAKSHALNSLEDSPPESPMAESKHGGIDSTAENESDISEQGSSGLGDSVQKNSNLSDFHNSSKIYA